MRVAVGTRQLGMHSFRAHRQSSSCFLAHQVHAQRVRQWTLPPVHALTHVSICPRRTLPHARTSPARISLDSRNVEWAKVEVHATLIPFAPASG